MQVQQTAKGGGLDTLAREALSSPHMCTVWELQEQKCCVMESCWWTQPCCSARRGWFSADRTPSPSRRWETWTEDLKSLSGCGYFQPALFKLPLLSCRGQVCLSPSLPVETGNCCGALAGSQEGPSWAQGELSHCLEHSPGDSPAVLSLWEQPVSSLGHGVLHTPFSGQGFCRGGQGSWWWGRGDVSFRTWDTCKDTCWDLQPEPAAMDWTRGPAPVQISPDRSLLCPQVWLQKMGWSLPSPRSQSTRASLSTPGSVSSLPWAQLGPGHAKASPAPPASMEHTRDAPVL